MSPRPFAHADRRSVLAALAVLGVALGFCLGVAFITRANEDSNEDSQITPTKLSREPSANWRQQLVRRGARQLAARPNIRRHRFSFLRHTRPKLMPAALRRAIIASIGRPSLLGLDFNRAHHLPARDNGALWLIEGRAVTCISNPTGATACDTSPNGWTQGLNLQTYDAPRSSRGRPHNFLLAGIAPNGSQAIRATVHGHSTLIPVNNGMYVSIAEYPITNLRLVR
jgi:hypothetical protein